MSSALYHPASNGLAERFVKSLKQALKASEHDGRSVDHQLHDYLLTYRSTPQATTGVSPFLNHSLRMKLDLLRPNIESQVVENQTSQKSSHDQRARVQEFAEGQSVLARNWRAGSAWIPARVIEKLGPVTYAVETSNHQCWKRHADQLKGRTGSFPSLLPGTDLEEEESHAPVLPTGPASRESNSPTVPMGDPPEEHPPSDDRTEQPSENYVSVGSELSLSKSYMPSFGQIRVNYCTFHSCVFRGEECSVLILSLLCMLSVGLFGV